MDTSAMNDFSELLTTLKGAKRNFSEEYSYEELAKRLGFRSARSIAMVAKRQRPPTTKLVQSACDYLQVSASEREFIFWLAEKSRMVLKFRSTHLIDEKIAKYRSAISQPLEQHFEAQGILIRIDPSVAGTLQKRAAELMRELISELKTSKQIGLR